MARDPIPTWFYALVVVRLGDRFLLVHEAKHGQLWYLPAGRVEPGESFAEAAMRETLEESGVRIELDGILKIEHTPSTPGGARMRVFFVARPLPTSVPKTFSDEHSLEARSFTLDEMARLPLRHPEALTRCREVAAGAPVAPMSVLDTEA